MSRFFVQPQNVGDNSIFIDDREDLHHMIKVLRLEEGDIIEVSDSSEWEYTAELISIERDCAEARIIDKQKFSAESEFDITLFQGIPKQGKMELIVQKSVELGVKQIVPVFMKRTVTRDKGSFGKKTERWQKIAAEAVKQCRRGLIPEVCDAVRSEELPELLQAYDIVLFPYENEENMTMKDALTQIKRDMEISADSDSMMTVETRPLSIAVIIGPEGGFSEEEASEITATGGISVSLGRRILRTETAGMAALSMIMYEMEL